MGEVEINELQDLLGLELFNDLTLDPTSAKNVRLLDGISWEYGGNTIKMHGIKHVLAYYFYAWYIYESDLQDTFSGFVSHNFDESDPANKVRKDKLSSRARESASKYWQEVRLYLDNHTSDYPLWCCGTKRKVWKPKIKRLDRPVMNTDFEYDRVEKATITPEETVEYLYARGKTSLSAGSGQKILFSTGTGSTNLGTINYRLDVFAIDGSGVQVFPVIALIEEDGFTVDLLVDATLNWEATQL